MGFLGTPAAVGPEGFVASATVPEGLAEAFLVLAHRPEALCWTDQVSGDFLDSGSCSVRLAAVERGFTVADACT